MPTESLAFRNALLGVVERRRRRAQRHVADADQHLERSVHELRRICKELRALWRIVRPIAGEEIFTAENLRLRDAARALAGARDRAVLLETIARIRSKRRGRHSREAWREAAAALQEQFAAAGAEPATASIEALGPALGGALQAFRATHEALQSLEPDPSGLTWQPGVKAVYRQARKCMKKAYESGADADFHNWRKSTKYLYYQLRLLERMKQIRSGGRVGALKKLERDLGRDHDLAVLKERIAGLAAGENVPHARVIDDVTRRSGRYRRLSRKPGKQLFADKPAAFIEAIEKRRARPRASAPAPAEEAVE